MQWGVIKFETINLFTKAYDWMNPKIYSHAGRSIPSFDAAVLFFYIKGLERPAWLPVFGFNSPRWHIPVDITVYWLNVCRDHCSEYAIMNTNRWLNFLPTVFNLSLLEVFYDIHNPCFQGSARLHIGASAIFHLCYGLTRLSSRFKCANARWWYCHRLLCTGYQLGNARNEWST